MARLPDNTIENLFNLSKEQRILRIKQSLMASLDIAQADAAKLAELLDGESAQKATELEQSVKDCKIELLFV